MLHIPKVLLMCDADKKTIFQEILESHTELTCTCTPREMLEQLERATYDALFCCDSSWMGRWSEVLEKVRQFYPHLPVVISSKMPNEKEWLEVIETGTLDLLSPPCYEGVMLPGLEDVPCCRRMAL